MSVEPDLASSGRRSVLVLSHLYPSSAFPALGPFVRDQVIELAQRNRIALVSPLKITPLRLRIARQVFAVPYGSTDSGISVKRPRFPGVPIAGLTVEPLLWASRLLPVLRRAYREIGGDLVHAHFALPDGFAASRFAARDGIPLVVSLWGSDVLRFGEDRGGRLLLRRTFAEARAVIAVSEELAERAEALGARHGQLRIIPGGVPYLPHVPRAAARAELGIDHETVCVLWVGGLVDVKQPLDVIRAFRKVRDSLDPGRPALLVIIGDGPLRTDVQALIRRESLDYVVRLLGHCDRESVWRWQCAADVLANSSRSEGTPLAALEALGAGTPVVGYPLAGVRAAVEAVGGGRVAVTSSPDALAEAILAELEIPRNRASIVNLARDRFHIEQTARAIEDVYASVT